jgi:hypothetical protein
MRIGTTPIHVFEISVNGLDISKIEITYQQNGTVILTKTEDDCTVTENEITTLLSQEDTFKFSENHDVLIQIRVLMKDGMVYGDDVRHVPPEECLSDKVLK